MGPHVLAPSVEIGAREDITSTPESSGCGNECQNALHPTARRLIVGLSASVFVIGAFAMLSYPAHHDLGWLLYVASAWLDGAGLYTELVEVNPPLIIWISAVAELVARATGAWNVSVYLVLALCAAAAAIVLSRRQLQRDQDQDEVVTELTTVSLAYAFVAGVGFEFGQREHLAIMLVFPFLLLVARELRSSSPARREDIVVGTLAGIGFALKPHFLLALVAVEVFALVKRRRVAVTAPHRAVLVVLALYGVAVVLFERDYFALGQIGAYAYSVHARVSPATLLQLPPAVWSISAVVLAFVALPRSPVRPLLRVLAVAAAAFLVAVLVQAKGWTYHWLPAVTITIVVYPLVLWAWATRLRPRVLVPAAGAAACIAVGTLMCVLASGRFDDARARLDYMRGRAYLLPDMIRTVERHAVGGTVAALSVNMQAAFPLVNYTDVDWGMRFNSFWLLPAAYPGHRVGTPIRYHDLDHMPRAERYLFEAVVHDLTESRPDLLIVDTIGLLRGEFDYLAYFGRDPRFATLMRSYHEATPVARYRIFVRTSS